MFFKNKRAEQAAWALVALVAVVAVVGLVNMNNGDTTGAVTGEGKGKVNAGQCLKDCLGIPGSTASTADGSDSAVQACKQSCGEFEQVGTCETNNDNCCVPGTNDPDCKSSCENKLESCLSLNGRLLTPSCGLGGCDNYCDNAATQSLCLANNNELCVSRCLAVCAGEQFCE